VLKIQVTLDNAVFMHDFAVPVKYTLFLDFPITLDIERAIAGGAAIDFEPDRKARIGIMPRYGSDEDIRWVEVATGSVVHTATAWDAGDHILLQASRSKTTDIDGAGLSSENIEDTQGQLYEWRVNLQTGVVEERVLSELHCDFTRINDSYACHKTRYVYAAVFNASRPFTFDGVMKYDSVTGESAVFKYGPQRFGGEAVFAPKAGVKPGVDAEDAGYLLCFAHDESADQSECIILDAQDVAAGPVATLLIPYRVPYGFHSGWVAAE